jgi:hypothetical protein
MFGNKKVTDTRIEVLVEAVITLQKAMLLLLDNKSDVKKPANKAKRPVGRPKKETK